MVYALHVFEKIKAEYPDAEITVLCKAFVAPLLLHNPAISSIIFEIPFKRKYDAIVELRGNWRTLWYAMVKSPLMRLERGKVRMLNKFNGGQKHETETNSKIIEPLLIQKSIPITPKVYFSAETQTKVEHYLESNHLTAFAVIHCGARKKLRQWPAKNYAALIKILNTKYNFSVVFTGTSEDEKDIEEVMSLISSKALICTREFNLNELAYFMQKAGLFIGNESGPLHIAAVMNTPAVGIFGPGVPEVFYPLGKRSRVVHHILPCNPCDQVHCIRPENPCIELATVMEVEEKISEIIPV